jgi:hypothetical protein
MVRACTARRGRGMLREAGRDSVQSGGTSPMQSAQPRDIGAAIFAIGVVLVLFIVSLVLGSPLR